jgi:hypothetical protein
MHHYTYWLTCNETHENYIGVRTSKIAPERDSYWSSSNVVKAMMRDGKTFTKQILAEWDTREEANSHEILLLSCFNAAHNDLFLNKHLGIENWCSWQGRRHTDETKLKMRKPRSEDTKSKMRKPKSKETKAKMKAIAALRGNNGNGGWNKGLKGVSKGGRPKGIPAWNKGKSQTKMVKSIERI